jgi:hypothetical protein
MDSSPLPAPRSDRVTAEGLPGVARALRSLAARRGLVDGAALALFWAAVIVYYVFVVSAGHWGSWFTWTAFYNAQAEGFRAGHLYIPEAPSAALRALPDPLNPKNMHFWRWDHSYYQGHLYLYWGFVPAALLAAGKALLRIREAVGDQVPVFVFVTGRAIVGTLLIRSLARAVPAAPPRWAVWLAQLVFVLANPIPYFLSRGAVYEAAISAGVLFMLCGLHFGLRGVQGAGRPGGSRGTRGWLAAAGFSFGLAAGSRISLLPAAGLLTALTLLACWRAGGGDLPRLVRVTLWGGVPALAVVVAQLAINRLRFGQWLEFGVSYQMGFTFASGLRFVPANLYLYLLGPVVHSCSFPFLMTKWNMGRAGTPAWLPWPADYRIEPAIGLLIVVPFLWLLIIAAPLALARMRARRAARAVAATVTTAASGAPASSAPWTRRWVIGALAISILVTAVPPLLIFSNSMRYEWDFASGLMLAATLAGWSLLRAPRSRRGRIAAAALFAVLAIASIVAGVLLGFVGYFDHFARHNPALLTRLKQALDLCRYW